MSEADNGGVDLSGIDPTEALAGVVRSFAPHLTAEQAVALVEVTMSEQDQLGVVLDDALNQPEYVLWGVKLRHDDVGEGVITAHKQLGTVDGRSLLQDASFFATIFALATTPILRAILRAYGIQYEFVQAKPPSKLIM